MRRTDPRRLWALTALAAITALSLVGAGSSKKRKDSPPPRSRRPSATSLTSRARARLTLEGVGLVVGLDNTGSNPGPVLVSRAARRRDAQGRRREPQQAPQQPERFSIVIVRLQVPHRDRHLRPARRRGRAAPGQRHQEPGRRLPAEHPAPRDADRRRHAQGGLRPGHGARAGDDRHRGRCRTTPRSAASSVAAGSRRRCRSSSSSTRTGGASGPSSLLESGRQPAVPHAPRGSTRTGWPRPRPISYLVLKVPRVYHHNQDRYFRVIKLLPIVDTPRSARSGSRTGARTCSTRRRPASPRCGSKGWASPPIETLKTGLASPNAQVRFFAAEALAYLNDASGVDVLAETATVKQPEFRAYALAALAATRPVGCAHEAAQADGRGRRRGPLRRVQRASDPRRPTTRSSAGPRARRAGRARGRGRASRCRWPSPGTARQNRRARTRSPSTSSTATAPRWSTSPGPAAARSSSSAAARSSSPPIVLGTGAILLNAADGDETIQISKIVPSPFGDADAKVQCRPLELGDVHPPGRPTSARSTPRSSTILQAAERQKNLPGPLVVDAVPGSQPRLPRGRHPRQGHDRQERRRREAGPSWRAQEDEPSASRLFAPGPSG